jgi:hypothetical protein
MGSIAILEIEESTERAVQADGLLKGLTQRACSPTIFGTTGYLNLTLSLALRHHLMETSHGSERRLGWNAYSGGHV